MLDALIIMFKFLSDKNVVLDRNGGRELVNCDVVRLDLTIYLKGACFILGTRTQSSKC